MTRKVRCDLYRLLGGILEQCPSEALCRALLEDRTLERLGAAVRGPLGHKLVQMHAALAGATDGWQELRLDYVRLFVGPKKKLAPPWESVYRTRERLVMREPEHEVRRAYAAQEIGFPGMGREAADHIGFELEFCALLAARYQRAARLALRRFLDEHLLRWLPAFAADVEQHARTDFFRCLGGALAQTCQLERAAGQHSVHLAVV